MLRREGTFFPLFHNELEKLWAHRSTVLIVAFLVMVVGGSFLVYRSHQATLLQARQNIQQMEQQVVLLRHQELDASSAQKAAARQALQSAQQTLKQMKLQGSGSLNLRADVQQLKGELLHQPPSQQGPILEQLAVAQGAMAKGLTQQNSLNGFKLAGDLFDGGIMLLFGLLTVGLVSDRFSAELEGGTWGVLLLHAPQRLPIFWAKLSASLALLWGFMLATTVGLMGLTGLLVGFGPSNFPVAVGVRLTAPGGLTLPLVMPRQPFHLISQLSYDGLALLLAMLSLGILAAICLCVSVLTRSSVLSLIVGAVLVLSEVFAVIVARWVGWLVLVDPAVHLPLIGDWTGGLAQQYNMADLTLSSGLVVLLAWGALAVAVGMWHVRRIDL